MAEAQHNKVGRINFEMYYINDIYKWGYEVVDTLNNQTLKRGYNYATMEQARVAGFDKAKQVIGELAGHEEGVKQGGF